MKNILLFGPPAAGKGTMSTKLKELLGLHHLSTGDIIRNEISNQTETGKLAQKIMAGGNLLSDEIVIRMTKEAIINCTNENGILFDGFPRTVAQAKALEQLMFYRKKPLNIFFNLKINDWTVIERIKSRGARPGENPEKVLEESKNRLAVYKTETAPVLDYFRGRINVVDIDAEQPIDAEFAEIMVHINKLA